MLEPRILICGTADDAGSSQASLELLETISLADAAKFVVTTGKFETRDIAAKFNVEADYPPEPAQLRTYSAWAELEGVADPRLRDGYDLFCLRRILAKHRAFSHALLLRHGGGFENGWTGLAERLGNRLFVRFGEGIDARAAGHPLCNVLFRLNDVRSADFLDRAWDLYASCAVYAIEEYDFEAALDAAAATLRSVAALAGESDCGETDGPRDDPTVVDNRSPPK